MITVIVVFDGKSDEVKMCVWLKNYVLLTKSSFCSIKIFSHY